MHLKNVLNINKKQKKKIEKQGKWTEVKNGATALYVTQNALFFPDFLTRGSHNWYLKNMVLRLKKIITSPDLKNGNYAMKSPTWKQLGKQGRIDLENCAYLQKICSSAVAT